MTDKLFLKSILYMYLVILFIISPHTFASDQKKIQAVNKATYLESGRYQWTIFLIAKEQMLDEIECVEYTLHPSLPDPKRIICDRETSFALTSYSRDEFTIFIKIIFKTGRQSYLKHMLRLEKLSIKTMKRAKTPLPEYGEIYPNNTARYIGDRLWEWTVFIETDEETHHQINYVEYILHPTYREPVRKIFTKENNFALTATGWGAFEIKIRVFFNNDGERHLSHVLRFEKEEE